MSWPRHEDRGNACRHWRAWPNHMAKSFLLAPNGAAVRSQSRVFQVNDVIAADEPRRLLSLTAFATVPQEPKLFAATSTFETDLHLAS